MAASDSRSPLPRFQLAYGNETLAIAPDQAQLRGDVGVEEIRTDADGGGGLGRRECDARDYSSLMKFSPNHPDEPALHSALRDALNEELENRDFFVWLDVRPTGKARRFEDLGEIVIETEKWLEGLDPDAVQEKELPKHHFDEKAASIEITALPRKPEVRDRRADEIVGNPGPILIGWDE